MSNCIYVNLKWLQKCDELKDDIEEAKDLWEVNQALTAIDNNNFNLSYIQNLIYRMEQKYDKEIHELESMAARLSSNCINNSYSRPYSPIDQLYQALLRIRFAICFKICKKKCFIKCIEEFMDVNRYK